jgi:phosphatidylglycerol---prolipoprotein diacylglyceryl transferase
LRPRDRLLSPLSVRPVFFTWRGLTVHSYPAMQYIGLTFGVIAGNFAARSAGLDPFRVYIATILLLFPALAGARVLYIVSHWDLFRDNRRDIWNTRQGGAAQYGGILAAVPLSIPLLALLGIPFGAFWDAGGITIMVGMVFTRVGCFMNGCCAGRPSSSWLALSLPNVRGVWIRRFPTQLLEAAWAATLLVTGVALWPRLPFDGALFLFIASGYALGRLVMESMRELKTASRRFTIHHAISVLIIVSSLVAITARGTH